MIMCFKVIFDVFEGIAVIKEEFTAELQHMLDKYFKLLLLLTEPTM